MSCHSDPESSWELIFLQVLGRIGDPIGLKEGKNKLSLPEGAVQLLAWLLRWSQIISCSQLERSCLILSSRI